MVDPNAPELLAVLETFADEVQAIFSNGEQGAETGPIAARQKQNMLASLAVAKLLRTIGRPGAAELGHKTPKMAMFYCEQARQQRMNENAIAKWDAAIEKNAGGKPRKLRIAG